MNAKYMKLMVCAALFYTVQAKAQGQAVLSVNTDARTAAMGNVLTGSEGMYLYSNPPALFYSGKKFTADASASVFEKDGSAEGVFGLYTASVGCKLAGRHAAFTGFKYAGGLKFKGYDSMGEPTKDYKPYDWTIDFGYAYMIGNGFSAYATGSVIFSHLSKNATGGAFTIGGVYRKDRIMIARKPASLILNAKVGAMGPKLDYGNGFKTSLPTHMAVGGELMTEVAPKHKLGTALAMRYFFQPSESKVMMAGGGVEYTYNDMVSVRTGYEYGDHDLGHFTVGAGFKHNGFRFNGAYIMKTSDMGNSCFMAGLGLDF
ncbi:MAG: PorV/PorQ family protein [Prevotellaceae bacterium]|nr:PorV/PorQ family protein [Prevotellaceae bacterium]MDY6130180.1 PorV/PorQ family protein [Prevotella sp.]